MVPIELAVSDPWYSLLRAGEKTVEGRKANATWRALTVGTMLRIVNAGDATQRFTARVTRVSHHKPPGALKKFLTEETLARTLPGVRTYEYGEAIYRQWWTDAEIAAAGGVLGLELAIVGGGE